MADSSSVQDEAVELLGRRLADMRWFCSEEYDPESPDDEHGDVYDYGLEWSHELTNHRTGELTYRHVLSTGGPHDEFVVSFCEDASGTGRGYEVTAVTFVYLPWFDRVEIPLPSEAGTGLLVEAAQEFYSRFFADLVGLVRGVSETETLRAELVVMRGLRAGAVDACKELQARLDTRAADLGRFTQSAVSKTKELEAERDDLRARLAAAEAAPWCWNTGLLNSLCGCERHAEAIRCARGEA